MFLFHWCKIEDLENTVKCKLSDEDMLMEIVKETYANSDEYQYNHESIFSFISNYIEEHNDSPTVIKMKAAYKATIRDKRIDEIFND